KLAAGTRELDYRLVTSDQEAARRVAAETSGIQVVDDARARPDREVLVVRALVPALDELVPRLVHAGLAVREPAPGASPLEAAFLALTDQQETGQCPRPSPPPAQLRKRRPATRSRWPASTASSWSSWCPSGGSGCCSWRA